MISAKNLPKVSVGIPTYNNLTGLRATLECITKQTYNNLEIIISDNNSDDADVEKIVREYMIQDSRIIYHKHTQNNGGEFNFSYVLEQASGKYFMWAADDDLWDKTFVEKLVDRLEIRPDCAIAFCSVRRINEDGSLYDILTFAGIERPDRKNNLKLALDITTPAKYNIFIYGIFRTAFIKDLLYQGMPELLAFDRIFILHVSLATNFEYVDQVLFTKTVRSIPDNVRRPEEKRNQKSYFPTLLYMWPFILKSRVVPLRRKLYTPFLFTVLLVKYAARDTVTKLLRATLFKNPKLKKYIKELYLSRQKTHERIGK